MSIPESPAFLWFVVASLALLVMPGPAVMYIVARSIDQGRAAGIVSALGLAVLPQFVVPGGNVRVQIVVLGLTFTAMGVVTDTVYAMVAGAAGDRLEADARFPRVRRVVVATTYITLSILALLVHPTNP